MRRLFIAVALTAGGLVACTADPGTSAGDPSVVARVGSEAITQGQLDAWIKDELWKDQTDNGNALKVYELRSRALDRLIDQRVLQSEAKTRGVDPDHLLDVEAAKRVTISDQDVKEFYAAHKAQLGSQTLEQLTPRIKEHLERERGSDAARSFVAELRAAQKVETLLAPPRIVVAGEGHAKGPADAPITLIEFSDYQCPFCRRAEPAVEQVLKEYAGRVRFVYRHFPLEEIHPLARGASEAALCADEQGHFWEYHAQLFGESQGLAAEQLEHYASEAKLDVAAFKACLAARRGDARIDQDLADGKAAGVTGTPAFFVNGIPISGAQPVEEFRKVIEAELARKTTAPS